MNFSDLYSVKESSNTSMVLHSIDQKETLDKDRSRTKIKNKVHQKLSFRSEIIKFLLNNSRVLPPPLQLVNPPLSSPSLKDFASPLFIRPVFDIVRNKIYIFKTQS